MTPPRGPGRMEAPHPDPNRLTPPWRTETPMGLSIHELALGIARKAALEVDPAAGEEMNRLAPAWLADPGSLEDPPPGQGTRAMAVARWLLRRAPAELRHYLDRRRDGLPRNEAAADFLRVVRTGLRNDLHFKDRECDGLLEVVEYELYRLDRVTSGGRAGV